MADDLVAGLYALGVLAAAAAGRPMAVTPAAQIVSVGVGRVPADDQVSAIAAALAAAGVVSVARIFIEDDEAALERALTGDIPLTVVVAGPGGSAVDIVRRALARLAGVRLVLNDRMLAALEVARAPLETGHCRGGMTGSRCCPRAWPCGPRPTPSPPGPWRRVAASSPSCRATAPTRRWPGRCPRCSNPPSPVAAARPERCGVAGRDVAEVEERLVDWLGPSAGGAVEGHHRSRPKARCGCGLRVRGGGSPVAAAEALITTTENEDRGSPGRRLLRP